MMKDKIMVLGSRGMLGHVVKKYFEQLRYEVIGFNRKVLDLRNYTELDTLILEVKPRHIINCAGILITGKDLQEFAELNIVLPRMLAHICKREKNIKLTHISSNCVFKGLGPHSSEDKPDSTNIYGISKYLGEVNDKRNLTIRCSITGPELKTNGSSLMEWFINKTPSQVSGYTNALWNGVTTLQLAKFIHKTIDKRFTGLINYYTRKEENKYEVLKILNDLYGLKKEVVSCVKEGIHSALLTGPYYTEKTLAEQFKELKEWYEE